jgi:hypothetical protein
MGNWRTVRIIGECGLRDVPALRDVTYISDVMDDDKPWLALCGGNGLCSLGDWASTKIDVGGNCFERDYSIEDIADHLRQIAAAAPSARLKVHCGDDWESETCIATVVLDDAGVRVEDPEVPEVEGVDGDQMIGRLHAQLGQRRL